MLRKMNIHRGFGGRGKEVPKMPKVPKIRKWLKQAESMGHRA